MANAYFDRARGEIVFGYVKSGGDSIMLPAGKYLFSSLSADIIAHEVSHAILDGLRSNFDDPQHPDVLAFHEAFADLIALFQRFAFPDFLDAALRQSRADLFNDALLVRLAPELARAGGLGEALRTFSIGDGRASSPDQKPRQYDPGASLPPHEHGKVLTEAVFEAFVTIVARKIEPLIALATGGTGILPPGRIPELLLDHIVHQAIRIASQFRTICIRAIDYCPPVSIQFSDYLRAMITADHSLVKDDPFGYREALVDAFRRRNIYPESVRVMSESTLIWNRPERDLEPVRGLGFSDLEFLGDPGIPARPEEIIRQATVLGERITSDRRFFDELGLVRPDDPSLEGDTVDLPVIASVRPARRSGPDGQIGFDLVAEVLQTRYIRGVRTQGIRGGATIILSSDASVRHIIHKRLDDRERVRADAAYLTEIRKRRARGAQQFCIRG